jgi:NTE family protein
MRTLVLSGAGNFGALQAGALEPVLETGFLPELIVGTSAGALNGLLLATDPSPAGARRVQSAWRQVSLREIGTPGLLGSVRRLITQRDSLLPSVPLARFVARSLGLDLETFGQLQARHGIRVRTMAVCMGTGELVAFGNQDKDRLIDGAMSSTAVRLIWPPPAAASWMGVLPTPADGPSSAAPRRSWRSTLSACSVGRRRYVACVVSPATRSRWGSRK